MVDLYDAMISDNDFLVLSINNTQSMGEDVCPCSMLAYITVLVVGQGSPENRISSVCTCV